MAAVNREAEVHAPAAKVWTLFADFGGLDKISAPGSISDITLEGKGIGSVRVITSVAGVVRERLEIFDPDAMRIGYTMDNDTPFPLRNYMAVAKISPVSDDKCLVNWQSTFEPVGDEERAKQVVRSLYDSGLAGVRRQVCI